VEYVPWQASPECSRDEDVCVVQSGYHSAFFLDSCTI
jgi:hypothetical protein